MDARRDPGLEVRLGEDGWSRRGLGGPAATPLQGLRRGPGSWSRAPHTSSTSEAIRHMVAARRGGLELALGPLGAVSTLLQARTFFLLPAFTKFENCSLWESAVVARGPEFYFLKPALVFIQ